MVNDVYVYNVLVGVLVHIVVCVFVKQCPVSLTMFVQIETGRGSL